MSTQNESTLDGGWLERTLREVGQEHRVEYLDDDGFTDRVVARLPLTAALPAWRRPAVALLWVLAGVAAVFSLPGLFEQVFRGSAALLFGHRLGVLDIAAALVLMAIATWSGLIYVARSE